MVVVVDCGEIVSLQVLSHTYIDVCHFKYLKIKDFNASRPVTGRLVFLSFDVCFTANGHHVV
jgi:hypothetical protein